MMMMTTITEWNSSLVSGIFLIFFYFQMPLTRKAYIFSHKNWISSNFLPLLSSSHCETWRVWRRALPAFFFVSGLGDIQVWRMFFRGRWDEIFCQQCNRAAASRATLKWAIKAEAAEDARNIFSIIQETISSDRDDYRNFIAILSSMRVENQQENHIVHTTQSRRAAARRAENHIQINGRKFYDNSSSLPSFDIDSSQQHFSSLKQHTWFFFLSCFRCSLGKYCDEVKSNEKMEDKKKKK